MTRLRRTAARAGLVAVAAVALTFAAAPVGAHTGSLFTVQSFEALPSYFASVNPTNAALANLPTPLSNEYSVEGIEIYNETGYALVDDNDGTIYITTWNHSTGATGVLVPLIGGVDVSVISIFGLDTTPDGQLLAFAEVEVLEGEFPVDYEWVVEIDPVTGVITEIVDITGATEYLDGIATDPTTGITYAFVDLDDGTPQYLVLDLIAGTYTGPIDLDEVETALGAGFIYGADFDTSGKLWFWYSTAQDVLAYTTGPFSETVSAAVAGNGSDDTNGINLAYDPYVKPQLADTGLPVAGIVAGGVALVGVGALGVFMARRRTA